ncbi:MAG: hypothetical protein LLG05_18735 [Porphyromonadaceae bacterium]|nr:hypothetical protein [Porphyromonadaceae bacterium]
MSQVMIDGLLNLAGKGYATGGTKTTLIDARKNFEADILNDKLIKIRIGDVNYFRKIADTTTNTLTFTTLPGTPAAVVWTIDTGVTITVTSVADGGNEYSIVAALATGNNQPLAAALVGDVITVSLATGVAGASDDTANTVTLVTAAIDGLAGFTAVAAGLGSTVVAPATVEFSGGTEEVKPIDGTPYEVAWR